MLIINYRTDRLIMTYNASFSYQPTLIAAQAMLNEISVVQSNITTC